MEETLRQATANQESITALGRKAEHMAGGADAFRRDAGAVRRDAQLGDLSGKAVVAGAGALAFLVLFGPWLFS